MYCAFLSAHIKDVGTVSVNRHKNACAHATRHMMQYVAFPFALGPGYFFVQVNKVSMQILTNSLVILQR